jgi:hypothetical protein
MDAATFLNRVLPTGDNAYLNLHFFSRGDNVVARGLWGRAFQDVTEMASYAVWSSGKKNCVYFCCASQLRAEVTDRVNQRGAPQFKAIRSAANARAMKALWMDIDIGKPGAYESVGEAVSEIASFCEHTAIPKPTIIVASGSGVHVYWTFTAPVTPDQWKVMATALKQAAHNHGLRQDPTRTADAASILRVPDTVNWKDPANPKSVSVLGSTPADIDPQRMSDALQPFVVRMMTTAPQMAPGMGDLTQGLNTQARPVNIAEILPNCAVFDEAAQTGGADHMEPLWYQMIRATTYAENGREWAHRFSKGHPDYDEGAVDKKFDQAVAAKEANDLGWPRCEQFHQYKSALCQACPRFALKKSPLNFRNDVVAPDDSNDLPKPYFRHAATKLIMVPVVEKVKDPDGEAIETETNKPVLDYAMWDAELIEELDKQFLRFKAQQATMKRTVIVVIPLEKLADQRGTLAVLGSRGIMVTQSYAQRIREFLMSWVKKLQTSREATRHPSFGWVGEGEKTLGFAYGGAVHTPDGELPVLENALTQSGYAPTGELDHWRAAVTAVCASGRPQIDAIIASAFAAPLVRFTEQKGMVLSFVGDTGVGKSTAINTAMAVWGDPHGQKNSINDTINNLSDKLGLLRSLPVYWDEVRELSHSKQIAELIFRVGEGKDKSRMTAGLERREGRTWHTMMIVGSNNSMLEYVADASPESAAGIMRIIEIRVPAVPLEQQGQFTKMDEVVGRASRNYGHAGLVYAKHLGNNADAVRKRVRDVSEMVNNRLKCTNEERLWAYTITTLLVGAEIANNLGLTTIDIPRLAGFLLTDVINDMRNVVNPSVGLAASVMKEPLEIVSDFLMSLQPDRYLATDDVPLQKQTIIPNILNGDLGRLMIRRVEAHCITKRHQLRLSRHAFMEYAKERGMYRRGLVAALEKEFGVKTMPLRLGLGTQFAAPTTEHCLVFNLTVPGLERFMFSRNGDEKDDTTETPA